MREIKFLDSDNFEFTFTGRQYIGLNDINNVEIFEGDILESIKTKERWTVEYRGNGFYALQGKRICAALGIDNIQHLKLAVIGNIYENSEASV